MTKEEKKLEKTLKEILGAFNALQNADREHKDTKKEGLDNAKIELEEFKVAIAEARTATADEAGMRLSTMLACWDTYQQTKSTAAEDAKAKKELVDEADKRLKELIGDARQGKLFD